jgi:hypothetical protein
MSPQASPRAPPGTVLRSTLHRPRQVSMWIVMSLHDRSTEPGEPHRCLPPRTCSPSSSFQRLRSDYFGRRT